MPSDKKSRHFEIKYLQRSFCYEVRIRDDVLVRLAIFPPEEKIVGLWNEATGAKVDYLRQPPSRPEANFFLIAPEESTSGKDRRRFLEMLEAHCTFLSSEFTLKDLAVAQATLSQTPLYLVAYDRHGVRCEEFLPLERAVSVLNTEIGSRCLLESVLELKGSSLRHRTITLEERRMIGRKAQDML